MIFNYLKDTNFDFERCKTTLIKGVYYVDAYYIPDDEVCPNCSSTDLYNNGYVIKTIKHCVYYTSPIIVKCHIKCFRCKKCNTYFRENDPFSNPNETISKESIAAILFKLKHANETFESVARDLHLSKQLVISYFDKYVNYEPDNSLPEIMCFDEKHINKNLTDKTYLFVIVDFKKIKIYDIIHSRHKMVLEKYFSKFPLEVRRNVRYITMDMWDTYLDIAKKYFKNAIVAIDSFHVMENINRAMDNVRISVMRKYNLYTENIEDNDKYYYLLKKFDHYFVTDFDKLTNSEFYVHKLRMKLNKHSLLKYMLDIDDNLKVAYKLTSKYREFNRTCSYDDAKEELDSLIDDFYNSKISHFIKVADTLYNWRDYIVNSFIRIDDAINKDGECRRLSNGPIEGLNATLEKINNNGNGYKNFYRFKTGAFML